MTECSVYGENFHSFFLQFVGLYEMLIFPCKMTYPRLIQSFLLIWSFLQLIVFVYSLTY